jgi:hypothetical protein
MIPGMYSSSTTIWRALGNLNSRQIEKLRLTAQEKLLNDLTTLNSQSYLTTQIGMSELLNFNRQDVWFIFRLLPGNLDGRTFFSEKPSEAFRASYSLYTIQVAPTNTVEVNVSFTRNPRIVGGILTEILREITAGGANATTYKASSRYRTYASSTSDSMMIQLCGEDVIETYWQEIPYTYRSMKVVPRLDDVTDTAPVCVLEEVNR